MKEYFVAREKLEGKIQLTLNYWRGLTGERCQCEKLETQKILQVEGSVYYLRRGRDDIFQLDMYEYASGEFQNEIRRRIENIDADILIEIANRIGGAISEHKKRLKEYAQRMETLAK